MLPDAERLRRASLFQRTYSGRKSISSPLLTLYVLPRQARSNPKLPLVGFVVGKKVDTRAVRRNQIKRRVRDAYRSLRVNDESLKQWYSIVWIINTPALEASFEDICGTVAAMIQQAAKKYGTSNKASKPVTGEPAKGA